MKYSSPRPSDYKTRVKRSASGLGLFAEESIPKGKFVIEYWGDLMTDGDSQKRGGKYLFELGNGKTVDGASRQNMQILNRRLTCHSCRRNIVHQHVIQVATKLIGLNP